MLTDLLLIFVFSRLIYLIPTSKSTIIKMSESVVGVIKKFYEDYQVKTATNLKIIDLYLAYILVTGVIQFIYCVLVGTFPFNSFLSGFISCVSSFVLAVNLRLQVNPENATEFKQVAPQRAFADFLFAHVVLHLVVMNFIG